MGKADEAEIDRARFQWALRYGRWAACFALPAIVVAHFAGLFTPKARLFWFLSMGTYVVISPALSRVFATARNSAWVQLPATAAGLVFTLAAVYVTSSLTSPLTFYICSMWAASVGAELPNWRGALVVLSPVAAIAAVGFLEYSGAIPHMPFFENGDDPGLYRNGKFVAALPLILLAHTVTLFVGTSYLSKKLTSREVELAVQKQSHWAELGQLSAALAHAVKNSLVAIKGFAFLIEKNDDLGERWRRMAGSINREAEHLNTLVARYLGFTANRTLNLHDISLNLSVQRALTMFESPSSNDGISVVPNLEKGLSHVRADAERLHELLLNLLQNAREAVNGGGRIGVETRSGDRGFIEFEVTDSGPGIPEGVLPRIFDPFFTTKPGGSGLGLAEVRRIAAAHGGSVTARNRPEGGASFTLRLKQAEP